jgi:hypothetical protein
MPGSPQWALSFRFPHQNPDGTHITITRRKKTITRYGGSVLDTIQILLSDLNFKCYCNSKILGLTAHKI